jgi:hypothetical protein
MFGLSKPYHSIRGFEFFTQSCTMRLIYTLKQLSICICFTFILLLNNAYGQVCSNPGGIIYGMGMNGGIYPINTSNGAVGARINPAYTGNQPASPNAMGWDPLNRSFLYFKRNADQSPQEFVSFNTTNNTYTRLASCPTTINVKTGCVNHNSTGYYCIDDDANFFYYRINPDRWRTITSTYYDQWGRNITSILASLSSGDISIDGFGQLWFLCSNNGTYGLYKFPMPLPQNSVTSITLTQVIAPTTPTPNGGTFAGIAFSPTGQIYLSMVGNDRFYRLNNNNSLTYLGTFTTAGVGTDLTSCNYPMTVLASTWQSFTVETNGDQKALLSWTVSNQNSKGYFIEYSNDAENWKTLAFVASNGNENGFVNYTYSNYMTGNGTHYYRIRQAGPDGQASYSSIKFVDNKFNDLIAVGPNPTTGIFKVNNTLNVFSRISIHDVAGKVLQQATVGKGINSFSLASLPAGTYLLCLYSESGQTNYQKIIKK